MIVQITSSKICRSISYETNEKGHLCYENHIRVTYQFVTQYGYSGYIKSPDFYICHFYGAGATEHECLAVGEPEIWFTLKSVTPYKILVAEDESGHMEGKKYYNEKYYYKVRFQNNTWVKLSFDNLIIEQLPESPDPNPNFDLNPDQIVSKSHLICPKSIYGITPINLTSFLREPGYFPEIFSLNQLGDVVAYPGYPKYRTMFLIRE